MARAWGPLASRSQTEKMSVPIELFQPGMGLLGLLSQYLASHKYLSQITYSSNFLKRKQDKMKTNSNSFGHILPSSWEKSRSPVMLCDTLPTGYSSTFFFLNTPSFFDSLKKSLSMFELKSENHFRMICQNLTFSRISFHPKIRGSLRVLS